MYSLHMERIVQTDWLATAVNRDRLKGFTRIVDLSCGHKAVSAAHGRCICRRCEEMMRRSIADGSEDWDSFRHRDKRDTMEWREDPLRFIHERID